MIVGEHLVNQFLEVREAAALQPVTGVQVALLVHQKDAAVGETKAREGVDVTLTSSEAGVIGIVIVGKEILDT